MTETNQNPRQKRNKIILILVIGLPTLCLIIGGIAYFSLRQVVTKQAKNLASQITDYDLPSGYKEMGGTTMFGHWTVKISDGKEKNTIWLYQFAPNENLPAPETFLEQTSPITWDAEDVKIYTIRGEETSITISNGITQDDQKYHAWVGKFTGKGGPAFIVIVGPNETWDENMAETFINSMR